MLKNILTYLSRYLKSACFFLLLQWIGRGIFILYQQTYLKLNESWLSTFINGFSLDIAVVAYLLGFLVLLDIVFPYSYVKIRIILFSLLSVVILLINLSDVYLFKTWNSKFNQDALHFLKHPKEVYASISHLPLFSIAIVTLLIFVLIYYLLLKSAIYKSTEINWIKRILFALGIIPIVLLGARQSFSVAPIGPSVAYYSSNLTNNLASLNSIYNFINQFTITRNYIDLNTFEPVCNKETQNKLFESYFRTNDSFPFFIQNKPNVVIILLESFNASLSNYFGKTGYNFTPFLDSLAKSGICFTNMIAASNRTDKAIAVINSGFYGTPWQSILSEPNKSIKLPQISQVFKHNGYNLSFNYAGDPSFGNMDAYLKAGNFEINRNVYSTNSNLESKWGFHDEVLFENHLKSDKKEPFFDEILTLSSHEPFDVPLKSNYKFGEYSSFFNSVKYTDNCLRTYFNKVKSKSWFKNTLFVLVADHGREIGLDKEETNHRIRQHIPCIFYGPALNMNKKTISNLTSQADIGYTLVNWLNLKEKQSIPGRNLFYPSDYAFYFVNDGWGLVSKDGLSYTEMSNIKTTNTKTDLPCLGQTLQHYYLKLFSSL